MSSELDIKFPEFNYDAAKKDMYEELKTDTESPFRNHSYAEIFLFAMALAKKNNMSPKNLEKPSKMPPGAFNGRMRVFMRSIMIDEKRDVYSISDNTVLRHMSEKYANAGIDMLYMKFKDRPLGTNGEDILAELIRS